MHTLSVRGPNNKTKVNKVSYEYREKQTTVESVLILTNDRKTPNRSLHKHWDGMRCLYFRNVKRHPDQLVWVAPFLRVSSILQTPSSTKVSEFRQIHSKSVDIYVHCTHTYLKLNMSLNGWLNHWHKLWSTSWWLPLFNVILERDLKPSEKPKLNIFQSLPRCRFLIMVAAIFLNYCTWSILWASKAFVRLLFERKSLVDNWMYHHNFYV